MTFVDLEPSAARMAELIRAIDDDRLLAPTPCGDYTLAALLDHVDRVALGFTSAASKTADGPATQSPLGDASRLGSDWRTRIPEHLAQVAPAWRDPAALEGMTRAGGIDLPGEIAVVVALEELVIHGWDVARASGQPYECDDPALEVVKGFIAQFAGDGQEELRGTAYATPIAVPDAAPLLDRVVGLSGRDPQWLAR
jgi:uncharacterized protein (TIGR03086 family)